MILLFIGSYIAGAIPFSYLIVKWVKGSDIRKYGDGNVGASNVSKVAGKKEGMAAFLFDTLKGILPVYTAIVILKMPEYAVVLAGLCAIIGHNWPIFLGFKGGKGMSTTIGVAGTLAPIEGLIVLIPFLILYRILNSAIISMIIIAPLLPLICWWRGRSIWLIGGTIIILAFVYIGSPENIKNAWQETKQRLSKGRK